MASVSLDLLDDDAARTALTHCCGARRWVEGMLGRRPFVSLDTLLAAAETEWGACGEAVRGPLPPSRRAGKAPIAWMTTFAEACARARVRRCNTLTRRRVRRIGERRSHTTPALATWTRCGE